MNTEIEVISGDDGVNGLIANLAELLRGAGSRRLVLILGLNMPPGSTTIETLTTLARQLEQQEGAG